MSPVCRAIAYQEIILLDKGGSQPGFGIIDEDEPRVRSVTIAGMFMQHLLDGLSRLSL